MADLHGYPEVYAAVPLFADRHAVDAVVLAGDLLRPHPDHPTVEDAFRAGAAAMTEALRPVRVPVLYVMGNDDMVDWAPDLPLARSLHGRRVDLGAWNFVGHPCSLPFIGSPFEQPEEEIRADLSRLAPLVDERTVLVTHGPAHGVHDGTWSGSIGSASLRDLVAARRPRAHVHGHVHFAFGRSGIHFDVASGGKVRGMVIDLEDLRHEVVTG